MSHGIIALVLAASFAVAQDSKPTLGQPDPIGSARTENMLAYRAHYLPQRARLAESKTKGWVAIVAGKLLPVDGDGKLVPAATWQEVERKAQLLRPGALHRFVFQVGEDGDSDSFYTMGEFPHGIGSGLAEAIRDATGSNLFHTTEEIWLQRGELERVISVKDRKGKLRVPLTVTVPGGTSSVEPLFGFASAFSGPAVVSTSTATTLGLALWEIPGTMTLNSKRTCRRARAHFSLKLPDGTPAAQVMCDVAIWPLRNPSRR